jgi:hypothetical protein
VRDILISNLGCTNAPLINPNTPSQNANLYAYTTCTTNVLMTCGSPGVVSINELSNNSIISSVYPNPSDNEMMIEFANSNTTHRIELFDVTGKLISYNETEQSNFMIKKKTISEGLYFLKITTKTGNTTTQKIIFK